MKTRPVFPPFLTWSKVMSIELVYIIVSSWTLFCSRGDKYKLWRKSIWLLKPLLVHRQRYLLNNLKPSIITRFYFGSSQRRGNYFTKRHGAWESKIAWRLEKQEKPTTNTSFTKILTWYVNIFVVGIFYWVYTCSSLFVISKMDIRWAMTIFLSFGRFSDHT